MRRQGAGFTTALRFTLAAHARNRLALVLAVTFVPLWIAVVRETAYHAVLHFRDHPAGGYLAADNNRATQVNCALNAVTVIVGFMMFMETFQSGPLDRRLVLAGYPRRHLMAGRVVSLLAVSCTLALYTALLLQLSWRQEQFWTLALAVLTANVAYGGMGTMLGALLRGELEGFFVIIMMSLMDAALQNPGMNPLANQPGLRLTPMYTSSQLAYAAAFSGAHDWTYLLGGLVWCALTTTAGLLFFSLRTRGFRRSGGPRALAELPAQPTAAGERPSAVARLTGPARNPAPGNLPQKEK
jgi:ABC-2 type transport system permease protein